MNAIIIHRMISLGSLARHGLALVAVVVAVASAQQALAQAATLSDTLFVSKNLTATPNNPDPQETFTLPELTPDHEPVIVVPLKDVLLKPGYVEFFEPDGQTPSDFLVSVTGASLQFYSDGAVNVDGQPVFPPNVGTLPQLGRFNETPKGLSMPVGDLFSIPGVVPIAAADIVMTSDGDVPEPTTFVLSALGLVGAVLITRKAISPRS
jgi:PEP-CTERM motif-containing protein